MQGPRFNSWIRKIPWRRARLPTPVFLDFIVAQLVKNPPAMRETWVRSLGWEDPLEKERGTHSSILAWKFHGLYSSWDCQESDMTERLSLYHTLSRLGDKLPITTQIHKLTYSCCC